MKLWVAAILLPLVLGSTVQEEKTKNQLPEEVKRALAPPQSVTLYALEPWEQIEERKKPGRVVFHNVKVLGKTELTGKDAQAASTAFVDAVANWDGLTAACFDPRHGLRVDFEHHHYDILLCYDCHQMEVLKDDVSIADLGAAGSPEVLNNLLKAAKVPLSYVYSEAYIKEQEAQAKKTKTDWEKWSAAVPQSVRSFMPSGSGVDPSGFFAPPKAKEMEALAKEFPGQQGRILAVLQWYGTDAGPWSGYPSYEQLPENILMTFSTPDIVAAIESQPLSEEQTEGAARLFGNWNFSKQRPGDIKLLPPSLKKEFLEHALKSKDDDKTARAKSAFQ